MFKPRMLVLVAAGLMAVVAPFAAAQDNSAAPPPSQDTPMQDHGHMRHGPPDPAMRTQRLTKRLNLTSDQQAKVQDIFQSEASQMDSLHQDTSLSGPDRHAKMMDIHKNTDTQVRALLDPTQQKKWDDMQARRDQWMEHRHQGPPNAGSDQQAPPPQQ